MGIANEGSLTTGNSTPNVVAELSESTGDACCSNPNEIEEISRRRVAPTDGSSPMKIKSLIDIYNSCTFALNVT